MVRRIQGITVELNGDTTGLTDALKDVDKATNRTASELREVERGLRFNPESTELLAQRQQLLAQQIGNTTTRLDALRQAQAQVQQQFDRGDIGAEQYRAFQRELVRTEGTLNDLQKRASQGTNVELNTDQAEREIGSLESSLRNIPSVATNVAGTASAALAGIGVAGAAGIGAFVSSFTEVNRDLAAINLQLDQAGIGLDNVTAATTAFTAVGQETDQIAESFGNLIQAGFSTETAINGISESIAGAIAFYGDTFNAEGLSESIALTTQLGEANGQFLDLLEREGVNLDTFNAQLGAISSTEERANFIAQTFADQGLTALFQAYADGNPEIIAQAEANVALERNLAALAATLTPLVTTVTEFANIILEAVNGNITFGEAIDQIGAKASSIFPQIASGAKEIFDNFLEGIAEVIPELSSFINDAIPEVLDAIRSNLPGFLERGTEIIQALVDGLSEALPTLLTYASDVIVEVVNALQEQFPQILETGGELISSLINGITQALPELIANALEIVVSIAGAILSNLPQILETGVEIISALISGLGNAIGSLISYIVGDLIPGMVQSFIGFDWAGVGADIVRGIISGIKSLTSSAIEAITGVANGVINAAKKILDINSPSRVFTEFGEFIGIGLANGIDDTSKLSVRAMDRTNNRIIGVQEDANKELLELNEELARDRAEAEEKSAEQIAKIQERATKEKRRLTTKEKVEITKITRDNNRKLQDLEKKAAQDRIKIAANESKAIEQVYKDLYDEANSFVQQKKALNQISVVDEAKYWRDVYLLFEEGSDQYISAQQQYFNASQSIQNELLGINQKYTDEFNSILENQSMQEQELTRSYEDALNSRASALTNFTGLFDEFSSTVETSGSQLISNLASQVQGLRDYQSEISLLEQRGLSSALIDELQELGPNALPQLQALNSLTGEELQRYSNLFEERSRLARTQAEAELIGLREDTQTQIELLRETTNEQLKALEEDWISEIQSIVGGTDTYLKTLSQIGNDAGLGLRDGLRSAIPEIDKAAREIADSVQGTIKDVLQIRSPSRVLIDAGRDAGDGLAIGLDDTFRRVRQSSLRLAQASATVANSLTTSTQRAQQGVVNQQSIINNQASDTSGILAAINQLINKPNETIIMLDGKVIADNTSRIQNNTTNLRAMSRGVNL